MDKDLLEISVNLAYAGMATHIKAKQNTITSRFDQADNDFAGTCVHIASQILKIADKTSKQERENGHGQD